MKKERKKKCQHKRPRTKRERRKEGKKREKNPSNNKYEIWTLTYLPCS